MRFTILQQDFLPLLQSVSRSVGIRSTLPVLDNILLSVEGSPRGGAGKKLKVCATNLEIGVIKFKPVDVDEEGAVTVPAKTLLELVSTLNQGKIDIGVEGEILVVRCGKLKAQINTMPSSEFPVIPVSSGKGIVLPADVLKSSAQILFAAASDEGRPVLTGVLTEVKGGRLNLVATDGFRLAHRDIALSKGPDSFKSLIPKKTFEEILRVLDEEGASEVNITTSENQNQIIFSAGDTLVSSRLIEGQFPAWEKIIPTNWVARAIVGREEFLKGIKLAAVFGRGDANIVILSTKEGSISLESSGKEVGSSENEIEAEVEGEQIKVAFNTKFLQDILSVDLATQVMIEFSGHLSAALIKPVGVEGLEYIIMPVRLS